MGTQNTVSLRRFLRELKKNAKFSIKRSALGTQKNRLHETVLLRTHYECSN